MTELVEALRDMATYDCGYEEQSDIAIAAADTIDRLTAENARLDEELGRCTSGNGTYISLESHDRILAKLTADLLQKTQQLTETSKALESDNYNAEMNLSRLTERLGMAVGDMKFVFEQKRAFADSEVLDGVDCICPLCACWLGDGAKSCDGDCNNAQWRGEESE